MSLLPKFALSKSFDDYHYLSEDLVVSDSYEIRKLINGEIAAIFYAKDTDTVLVQAAGYLWKINDQGRVIDTLRGSSGLLNSGVQLWTDSWSYDSGEHFWYKRLVDWIDTGNRVEQTLQDIVSTDAMSDSELVARLDQAEIVEFFSFRQDEQNTRNVALLKSNNRWTLLDITNRLGESDESCGEYNRRNKEIWQETCLEGYTRKYPARLAPLTDELPFSPDWNDNSLPIHIVNFSRDFYYYEEGFGNWVLGKTLGKYLKSRGIPGSLPESYWYGTGYFQLRYRSEPLKFKAFVSQEKDGINFKNLALYGLQSGIFAGNKDIALIEISYRGGEYNYLDRQENLVKHHEKDVGLYVIRKKPGAVPQTPRRPAIAWQPVFTGMKSYHSVWGDVNLDNGTDVPHHYLLDAASVPVTLHAMPTKLTFNWEGKNDRSAFKLYLNGNDHAWFNLRRDDPKLSLEIIFNAAEVAAAFRHFNGKQQPLQLEIDLEQLEKVGARLSLRLRHNEKSVALTRSSYVAASPHYGSDEDLPAVTRRFEKAKLAIAHESALQDTTLLPDFIKLSAEIAATSMYARDYANIILAYANDLLNQRAAQEDYQTAESIVRYFIDRILPHTGGPDQNVEFARNLEIIASNSLAVATRTHNEALVEEILAKLLGPGFDMTTLENATLLFNLACYYSLHGDKDSLLTAMHQALAHGKTADKFMTDTDFTNYWHDADFLRVLELKRDAPPPAAPLQDKSG